MAFQYFTQPLYLLLKILSFLVNDSSLVFNIIDLLLYKMVQLSYFVQILGELTFELLFSVYHSLNFLQMNRILRRTCFWLSETRPLQHQTNALRKQLAFRANNLGVRELDLVIGHWAQINLPKFQHSDLLRFNEEVLLHETPDLLKKVLGQVQIGGEQQMIKQIRTFALDSSISKIDNL